ncbi:hypothetical protein BGY98DRAFT_1189114 [Russula aff. rugulosa BPL654]|nr:hypothetical protein BGY98DRAFT_1189114 [Russula aff. rugulosa BPL654]
MPHTHTSVVSSSHSQLIVIRALKTYEKGTMIDLFTHPLAAQLRACNSPGSILLMLQQQVQAHNRSPSRCSHERLTHYLDPTVNVLYTFSLVLEEGVGFDISLAKPILAGVGVLLSAARDVCASYDIIADVLEHIVYFFRRLELYPEVSPTNEMKNIIAKMLMEVLSILAIATREIKQCRMKKLLMKLIGKTYIEDSLRVLDKLTQEEARMSTSQVLKAIIMSMNEDINESVAEIVYDGKGGEVAMHEKVNDVDKAKHSLSPKHIGPCDTVYAWEMDDSPPRYTPTPAYGTPEKVSLLLGHGAMVDQVGTKDIKGETTIYGLWDL